MAKMQCLMKREGEGMGGPDGQTGSASQINTDARRKRGKLDHEICLVFHNVPQWTNEPLRDLGVLWVSCAAPESECVHMHIQCYTS